MEPTVATETPHSTLAELAMQARNAMSLAVAIIDNGGHPETVLAQVRAELVRGLDGEPRRAAS